jgi:Cof subfamily protein (haloacid dehalogenase superfamily)
MKTAYYFDFDHTIFHNEIGKIPSQTIHLLKTLKKDPNVILGLATGRSISKLYLLNELMPLFDHFVLINGSTGYIKNQSIFKESIKKEDIDMLIKYTNDSSFALGMVSESEDVLMKEDIRIRQAIQTLHAIQPIVDETFYTHQDIFQMWVFGNNNEEIFKIAEKVPQFKCFLWHEGGADFIYRHIDKAYGIKKLRDIDPFDRLIAVGDGPNDITMIEYADIGIAMGNAKDPLLKEKAQLIAPDIKDNLLFDFFKNNHLLP